MKQLLFILLFSVSLLAQRIDLVKQAKITGTTGEVPFRDPNTGYVKVHNAFWYSETLSKLYVSRLGLSGEVAISDLNDVFSSGWSRSGTWLMLGGVDSVQSYTLADGCDPQFYPTCPTVWNQGTVSFTNPYNDLHNSAFNTTQGLYYGGQVMEIQPHQERANWYESAGPFTMTLGGFPNPGNTNPSDLYGARLNVTMNFGYNCGRGLGNMRFSESVMCDGWEGNWQPSTWNEQCNERHFAQYQPLIYYWDGTTLIDHRTLYGAGAVQRPISWYHCIRRSDRALTGDSLVFNSEAFNFGTSGVGVNSQGATIDYHLTAGANGIWTFKYVASFLNGVKLNETGNAQPTCDLNRRGTLWNIQGGAGVADQAQVCNKNADGSYSWKTIT